MLKTSISLAVAAVPEGLPAVAATTLALGIKSMKRHKVLIRNLDAVCTLGSVQTICFDKTGTITYNKMSVLRIYSGMRHIQVKNGGFYLEERPFDYLQHDEVLRLIQVGVLCNESQMDTRRREYVLSGSPTENALIEMAIKAGVDISALREQYPLLRTEYRSDNRQFMTTVHSSANPGSFIALKGSPVDLLSKCSFHIKDGVRIPLVEEDRDLIEAQNDNMAGDALRVLGMAYTDGSSEEFREKENGLTWLGLVGMADPIRDRVKESIEVFHRAGMETVMITGDQSPTAYAVGKELDLSSGRPLEILDSTHLTTTDSSVIQALSKQVHVFLKVSPSNKLQIVQALQSTGRVVAMTGDGINDGPALKAADIGIAMGRSGTDVARDVADVVLEEDDLQTLIIAITDGRTIYRNIRKTLRYLISTNFSEIQVMVAAGVLGLGYPLNAMQLLWINLISDIFPGLALALEPAEPDVMEQPPRDPAEPIIKTDDFKRITFEAATMTATSLAAYGYGVMKYGAGPGRYNGLSEPHDFADPSCHKLPFGNAEHLRRGKAPAQQIPDRSGPRFAWIASSDPAHSRGEKLAWPVAPGSIRRSGSGGYLGAAAFHQRSHEIRGCEAMKREFIHTSESVTEGHPDKLCDQISDAIIDRFFEQDIGARIIAECAVSLSVVFIAARFASKIKVDFPNVARKVIRRIGYVDDEFSFKTCSILTSLKEMVSDHRRRTKTRRGEGGWSAYCGRSGDSIWFCM